MFKKGVSNNNMNSFHLKTSPFFGLNGFPQVQLVPPVQSLIEKAAKYQETHIDRLKSAAFFAFVTGMFRT